MRKFACIATVVRDMGITSTKLALYLQLRGTAMGTKMAPAYDNLVLAYLDSHQYLDFKSCHPRHTKISIPYAQARRLCTIIDESETLDNRLKEMKHFFLVRRYPSTLIESGIEKARAIPQSCLE